MSPRNTIRDWARLLYYLSQNAISLIGVVLTTSSAVTLIAFWIYDFMLPGPPHPYVGILLFLILPALFFLGLVLIPIGILPSKDPASRRGIAGNVSGSRPADAQSAQYLSIHLICDSTEHIDFYVCLVSRRILN
jgi:hypothetical protein